MIRAMMPMRLLDRMPRALPLDDRRELGGLLLIVLLAAVLRVGRGDVVEYFHDDAMLSTLALELADGQRFPLTGILSSTGIPNSPVSVYFLSIPFALSSNPAVVIHFIMLWNVIGVALLWLLARRCCGRRVALLAGLCYAVNPWAVLFSRKIWAQELHSPFIILGFLLLLHGFWQARAGGPGRRSVLLAQCLGIPVLIIGLQFHFASWPLGLIIPISLWQGRKRMSAGALIIAVALSVIVCAPYMLGLTQTLENDPWRISDALARSAESAPQFSSASIAAVLRLASGSGLETWLAPDQAEALASAYTPLLPVALLLIPLVFIGILALFARYRRFAAIMLIWAFLPSFLLIIEWTPVYIHYFIPSIPGLALLIGLGLDSVMGRAASHRPLQFAAWLLYALILALQIQAWNAALDFVARRQVDYPGFTTPLAKLLPLQEELARFDDVLVLAAGMSWNLHHEVAVWDTLLWDDVKCARAIVPRGYAVFPGQPFAAVIAPDAPRGPLADLYRNESARSFPTREGGDDYVLQKWLGAPAWSRGTIRAIAPQRFVNGVQLTGYGWDDDEIALEWRLPARQVGEDLQFSAQLYDAQGERVDQLDARFWHGRHWCEGDRLLTFGALTQHEEASSLKVALYKLGKRVDLGSVFNIEVLDELGNPKGQNVDIPLDAGEA
ncbi:MAG: glycosyltransferase family 39 protein [Chloroflexota bacterium]|nr:glycosyltransferase family 39 protein [Chloroflexota bacterium]MDE2947194.1 glycosyltransferase family 39 protein [Chloroflexota bacterium]